MASIAKGLQQRFLGAIKVGRLYLSHKIGLTAAGTNLATGLQLTHIINRLDTVASSTGANLPPCDPSRGPVIVHNNGASTLTLYTEETSGVDIIISTGAVAGSTGIPITAHKTMVFFATELNWVGGSLGT